MIPGTLAFIKTTGEEVAVLGLTGNRTIPEGVDLSGTTAIVRRAIQGQNGITHVLDYFFVEELETLDERVRRDKGNQDLVRKTIEAMSNEDKAPAMELVN